MRTCNNYKAAFWYRVVVPLLTLPDGGRAVDTTATAAATATAVASNASNATSFAVEAIHVTSAAPRVERVERVVIIHYRLAVSL
jgi:hypothetical protein